MHVLGVLSFAAAVLTVSARHKKEWEFVDMKKVSREILLPYYRNEGAACTKGVGFYRDPNDCHQYIRCVDDFNTGRRLSVFVGRCRPGLVFDENISSCNWPELAAPCSNSPERFKDTASKFTPKEQDTQHVVQDNRISESSGNRNNYPPSQQQTIQKPHGSKKQSSQANKGFQAPLGQITNVFQETEVQGQFEESFEEPQTQITDQVREPQISQGFEEVPNNKKQEIPSVQQTREPVIQEKDEPKSEIHEPVVQQQTQQIREPVIQEQTQQIREPVVQEQTQQIREPVVQEQTQQIREPVIQEQTHQIREPVVEEQTEQIREPVVQEQTQQIQEPVVQEQTQQIREPVVQEQTQQIREPVVQEQNEPISQKQNTRKPIIHQQNHQEQEPSIWQETDSQEKIYQPIEEQTRHQVSQDTRRNNGQQTVHQQNTKDDVQSSQFQEQVSSGHFQEVPDSRPSQVVMPSINQQNEQAQSQWWVPGSQDSQDPATFGMNRENNKHRGHAAPTTLEEPILCFEEGFFRHPKNCSRFLRCVRNEHGSFSVHFFQCAKNLFFDEGISHCADSNNVKCTTRRTKREADDTTPLECKGEGFFRHPSDCRSFYRCVKQQTGSYETHLFSCPANLVFDEEYATCNWPDKAPPCENRRQLWKPTRASGPTRPSFKPYQRTTKGYKSTSKPRNDLFEPINPSTSRRSSGSRTTQKPRSTASPSRSGQLCNSPGFYRHDKDCTKFFKCVKKGNYFVRYELSCPQNFAYDENSSRCVSRRNVNSCNRRNTPFPPRQDDEESPQTTEATVASSESSQPPSEENEIKCAEEGYYRNPNDCNRFYRCVDFSGEGQEFVRYDFKCPEGLVFDETSSICNWPDQSAPCESSGGGGEGGKGESDEGEGESEATSSSPEETSSTTSQPTTRTTTTKRTTTARTKQPERSTSSPRRTTSRPVESTSGSGESTAKPDESTSQSENPQSNDECPQEGYFRNPEDCNKFYRCVDFSGDGQEFVRYDFACPEGLVFDESNSVCNWPSEAEPCDSTPGEGSDKDQGKSSTSTTQRNRESTTSRPGSTTSKPGSTTSRSSSTTSRSGSTKSDQPSTEVTDEESPSSSFRTEKPESSSSTTESSSSSTTAKEGSSGDKRGSSSNGECNEAGFFRNPDDCNKFYRCVDYNGDGQEFVKYDFSCPDGLVFDEENSVCNWPDQSAPCDGENNSSKDGSSTKQVENESSTSSTTQRRGEESTQSSSTQSTTESSSDKDNEETKSTGSTPTSKQTTPSDQSTRSTTPVSSTTSNESGREESTRGETSGSGNEDNGGECSEEGFYRNPDDCGKFYRCVDFNGDGQQFVRYDFDCPQGLHFDEANSVCNWPDQSPCENGTGSTGEGGKSTDSSTTSKSDSTTQQTQSETQSTSTTQSTTITKEQTGTTSSTTSGKESECSEPGFFRCSDDCNKFYRCVDENGDGQQLIRYDFKCPEGLIFDEKNKRCDFASEENPCDIESTGTTPSSTQSTTISATQSTTTSATQSTTNSAAQSTTTSATQSTTTSATQSTTTSATQSTTASATQSTTTSATQSTKSETTPSPTTTSISTTSSSSTSSSTKSSGDCTEEGYFRDPDDCSKYYRCIDEGDGTLTREEFSCAEDEVFDEEMRFCNRKDLAPPCEEGSSTQSTSTRAQDTTAGASSTTPSVSSETSSSSSTTPGESTTKDNSQSDCTESGFFRCKEDCRNFYRCVDENGNGENYVRYNFSCPDGLIFDEKNEKCDWPSDELTCDTETTSSSTTSSGSTSATSTPSSSTTSGSTSATSTASSSTTSSDSSSATSTSTSSDKCTEEGFFRNSEDCSKYYRCLDEGDGTLTREDFSCAEDEVFDEEMNFCNRKDLAPPCEGGSSSTTESSSQQPSSSTTGSESSTTESKPTTTTESSSTIQESSSPTTESSSTTQSPSSTTTSSSSTTQSTSSTNEETGSTESTTKGATDSSGECQEEGFHRHPDDCNKFYRCVDFRGDGQTYTRYDFECPEGLVFDETNSVCNWPSSVPSCESSDGKSSTSNDSEATSTTGESSSSSSTQDDGSQTSTTQEGTSSTTTAQEDKSSTTQADISSTSTTEEDRSSTSTRTTSSSTSRDNESTGSSTSTSMTTSPSEGSTTKAPSGEKSKDIECTEEGFFRNPDDCTKFYRCVDFAGTGESYVRYDFECPDDLVFDEVNSVCNWPNMSPGCESSSKDENKESKETTTEGNGATSTTESSTDSGASQTPSTTSGDSTKTTSGTSTTKSTSEATSSTTSESDDFQCEEEGFFKHPKDCKKYYECKRDEDTGELIKIDCECPDGHVFDSDGWYCNAEELSPPCDDGSFRCEEEGFFRDPEDCTGYYYCNETGSGFRKERFQCSDGNVFDEEGRYCNAPELSEPCNSTSSTTPSSQTTSASDRNTTPGGTSSRPSTSTSSGTESTSGGTTSSGQQEDCTEEGFFRNPEDCTKYYQCTRNEDSGDFERSDFTCPDGRVFDEGSNYCNDPELSEEPCETGSTTGSTTQAQTESSASSTTSLGTTNTNADSTTEKTTKSDSSSTGTTAGPGTRRSGGDPECNQEGFFRHPKDCNKFYRCVDFSGSGESYVRYDFDCPEGLHFDEVNSVCNWPTMTPPCTSDDNE